MADITERLRQYGDGLPTGLMLMRNAADEIGRLRARVAELEAERDAAFKMSRCECDSEEACRNLSALHRRVAELEAAPAPAVDVDAISEESLMDGVEAYSKENDSISVIYGLSYSERHKRCMRAALRAIFNKGE